MSIDTQKPPPAGAVADHPPALTAVRPSARCHACGDAAVTAVCSHCARLLCETHTTEVGLLGPRAALELLRGDQTMAADTPAAAGTPPEPDPKAPAAAPDPGGREPDEPDPERAEEPSRDDTDQPSGERLDARPRGSRRRQYCTRCAPRARPFDAELIAATTTAWLGAFVIPVQPVIGALLAGVGAVRLVARTITGIRRRARQARDHSADLVLNPNLRKIKTRERITGTIRLRPDRRYEATIGEVSGSVAIEGNWSRVHRAEVDRHRRVTRSVPISLAAGHLVLHGPGRVVFRPVSDAGANGGPALVLEPRLADQPVLSSAEGLGETRWRPEFRYDITPPDEGWRLPVWISPNIAANLDRHVLELQLQWCTRGPEKDDAGPPLRTIEVLEIAVPANWGTIEHLTTLNGDTYIGQPEAGEEGGPARRTLTWKKIPFKPGSDRGTVRLAVRFSDGIDVDQEVSGRIKARFAGTVSGLTRTVVYRTDGGPVKWLDGTNKPVTVAEVGFTLSLAGLRYQEQRAVPDRSRAEDVGRRETETFPGVVPDHRTVALLTNTLADEGYSIIRVQENPAQSSPRPDAVSRLWDLAGRYYEGVYPIEFHLQLGGEETHKGQEVSGNTAVTLTVHGSYANPEMEVKVIEEWTRLWKRIRLSLAGAGDGPRSAEQPLDAASSELARLRNVALTEVARLRAAADAGRIEPDLAAETADRITREFGLGEG